MNFEKIIQDNFVKYSSEIIDQTTKDDYKKMLKIWIEFRNKMDNFTLSDYNKSIDKASDECLTNFMEKTSRPYFGSLGIQYSNQYKIYYKKSNSNNNYWLADSKYISEKNIRPISQNEKGTLFNINDSEANTYFNEKLKPLFLAYINDTSNSKYDSLIQNENFNKFPCRKIFVKMLALDAKIFDNRDPMIGIFAETSLNQLCKLLGIDTSKNIFEKNIACQKKVLDILKIDPSKIQNIYDQLTFVLDDEKMVLEYNIYRAVWYSLKPYLNDTINDFDIDYQSLLTNLLNKNKQIILTGAPGTGKTYNVYKYVYENSDKDKKRIKFVQFHPNYDYSDFVEGLRPINLLNGASYTSTFVRQDGIFKEFCRYIVAENCKESDVPFDVKYLDKKICDENGLDIKSIEKTYDEIENKCKTKYYFIIDEINRADLSKVFGELMYGLEESYRGVINNRFETQYSKLPTYKDNKQIDIDVFRSGFFIPSNLYIIGTMNDIDRSVESFDFALRRRFQWFNIKCERVIKNGLIDMYKGIDVKSLKKIIKRINEMNKIISEDNIFGLNEDYQVGYAYFKNLDFKDVDSLKESLKNTFNDNIEPLLREYTRGRDISKVNDFIKLCRNTLLK